MLIISNGTEILDLLHQQQLLIMVIPICLILIISPILLDQFTGERMSKELLLKIILCNILICLFIRVIVSLMTGAQRSVLFGRIVLILMGYLQLPKGITFLL